MKFSKTIILIFIGQIFFLLVFIGNIGIGLSKNLPNSITLSPLVGEYFFDCDQDVKNSLSFSLGLGYNFTSKWAGEAMFNYVDTKSTKNNDSINAYLYHLDTLYHFRSDKNLVPYIAGGIGGITLNLKNDHNNTKLILNYGGGFKFFLNDAIALRADIRHILPLCCSHNNNFICSIGFSFLFDQKVKKKVIAKPNDNDDDGIYDYMDECPNTPRGVGVDNFGCPTDSDNDGVFDYYDKCPNTPRDLWVDNLGCPSHPDSDNDGVFDYYDKCPNTPRGVSVNNLGCPSYNYDSDGDGIHNNIDRCPKTPEGARVNQEGCCIIRGIFFDIDKWDIKPYAYRLLDDIVTIMRNNPSFKFEIQGHTDNEGSESYNKTLSEKRAGRVMHYLVREGVEQYRLKAKGFGFTKPVSSNKTPGGRAENRRVEFVMIP